MTKQDREESEAYCRQCTDEQLRNVYAKEKAARRTAFTAIARSVLAQRGLFTDDLIRSAVQ